MTRNPPCMRRTSGCGSRDFGWTDLNRDVHIRDQRRRPPLKAPAVCLAGGAVGQAGDCGDQCDDRRRPSGRRRRGGWRMPRLITPSAVCGLGWRRWMRGIRTSRPCGRLAAVCAAGEDNNLISRGCWQTTLCSTTACYLSVGHWF